MTQPSSLGLQSWVLTPHTFACPCLRPAAVSEVNALSPQSSVLVTQPLRLTPCASRENVVGHEEGAGGDADGDGDEVDERDGDEAEGDEAEAGAGGEGAADGGELGAEGE